MLAVYRYIQKGSILLMMTPFLTYYSDSDPILILDLGFWIPYFETQAMQKFVYTDFLYLFVLGGLLCFNVRDSRMDDFQGKMSELENAGIWRNVCRTTVPYFDRDDMPNDTMAFVYKVLMK